MVFKSKKKIQGIKDWLKYFQQTVDKAAGNQHLQFTAEIWTNNKNLPPSDKKDRSQIYPDDGLTVLDMNIRCYLEGDAQFERFSNKEKLLKYIRKGSTHKTGTLRAISSVLLNFLENSPCIKLILTPKGWIVSIQIALTPFTRNI